jgi:hypothetical protein
MFIFKRYGYSKCLERERAQLDVLRCCCGTADRAMSNKHVETITFSASCPYVIIPVTWIGRTMVHVLDFAGKPQQTNKAKTGQQK